MKLSKVVGIALILIAIWAVVTQPTVAASSVESIAATLERWAGNVTTFFTQVVT